MVRLFKAAGMNRSGARTLAAALAEADLRGVPGHGSRLAPTLTAKLRDGRLNPRPVATTVRSGPRPSTSASRWSDPSRVSITVAERRSRAAAGLAGVASFFRGSAAEWFSFRR
ncbi:Ldh family oxidoreductase [Kitasatospora sp. NPDC101155]|uniref:Ldh family oxidoreductase n=1 Tax=Kitasatospora sp. NPDC101155 TaxID=3364097 RepID=UPI0038210C50